MCIIIELTEVAMTLQLTFKTKEQADNNYFLAISVMVADLELKLKQLVVVTPTTLSKTPLI